MPKPSTSVWPFQDTIWPRNVTAITAITTVTRLVLRSSKVRISSRAGSFRSESMNSSWSESPMISITVPSRKRSKTSMK